MFIQSGFIGRGMLISNKDKVKGQVVDLNKSGVLFWGIWSILSLTADESMGLIRLVDDGEGYTPILTVNQNPLHGLTYPMR